MVKVRSSLSVLAMVIVMCTVFTGCTTPKGEAELDLSKTAAYIVQGEDTWQIKESVDTGKLVSYKNGEKLKDYDTSYNNKPLLELPEVPEGETADLSSSGLIADKVFEATLEQSAKYINHLLSQGYTIEYKAQTYKFIELFMKEEGDKPYKRLVITDTFLVESDVSQIPDVAISDYIFE